MYSGTPVIACNSGGPKESIAPGTGFLCEQTPRAFSEKILELVKDGGTKSIDMGKKGHVRVKERFGLDTLKPKYDEYLEEAIANSTFNKKFASTTFTYILTFFKIAIIAFGAVAAMRLLFILVGRVE